MTNKTIFVVEDEVDLLDLIREILVMESYTVLTASSASEAGEVWRKNSETIDLLLTDLTLPGGITGAELAQKLRGQKPLLKVVYASGHCSDLLTQQLVLPTGANFLQKPFHPAVLAQTIEKALNS